MAPFSLRTSLGVLLLALIFAACDDGGLTAPDTAAPDASFVRLLDEQIEAATAETVPDARAFAERAGLPLHFISAPTTITEPGVYLVTADFAAEEDAIVVESDNVFLSLGGYTLTGPGNKEGRGVVVQDAERVFVTGGTFETFGTAVELNGSTRSVVVGVEVIGGDEFADPPNGIPPQIGVLLVDSADNKVLGNTVSLTNLGFFVRGPGSMENLLTGNTAEGGENGLLAICYNPATDDPADPGPTRDTVSSNFLNGFPTGISASEGSAHNRFGFNVIYYHDAPYVDLNGNNLFVDNETMQL